MLRGVKVIKITDYADMEWPVKQAPKYLNKKITRPIETNFPWKTKQGVGSGTSDDDNSDMRGFTCDRTLIK